VPAGGSAAQNVANEVQQNAPGHFSSFFGFYQITGQVQIP
jgi:hypothetical protein